MQATTIKGNQSIADTSQCQQACKETTSQANNTALSPCNLAQMLLKLF